MENALCNEHVVVNGLLIWIQLRTIPVSQCSALCSVRNRQTLSSLQLRGTHNQHYSFFSEILYKTQLDKSMLWKIVLRLVRSEPLAATDYGKMFHLLIWKKYWIKTAWNIEFDLLVAQYRYVNFFFVSIVIELVPQLFRITGVFKVQTSLHRTSPLPPHRFQTYLTYSDIFKHSSENINWPNLISGFPVMAWSTSKFTIFRHRIR